MSRARGCSGRELRLLPWPGAFTGSRTRTRERQSSLTLPPACVPGWMAACWWPATPGSTSGPVGAATVRLSSRGRDLAGQLTSSDVISAVAAAEGDWAAADRDPGGWITAVIPVESLERAEQDPLTLGADVEVIEPASLRARIASSAPALAEHYGRG